MEFWSIGTNRRRPGIRPTGEHQGEKWPCAIVAGRGWRGEKLVLTRLRTHADFVAPISPPLKAQRNRHEGTRCARPTFHRTSLTPARAPGFPRNWPVRGPSAPLMLSFSWENIRIDQQSKEERRWDANLDLDSSRPSFGVIRGANARGEINALKGGVRGGSPGTTNCRTFGGRMQVRDA